VNGHISDVDIGAYCKGMAGAGTILRIEDHVLECEDCSRRANEAVIAILVAERPMNDDPSKYGSGRADAVKNAPPCVQNVVDAPAERRREE
jgi:hypothetical protein